jgi:hypothetical protein
MPGATVYYLMKSGGTLLSYRYQFLEQLDHGEWNDLQRFETLARVADRLRSDDSVSGYLLGEGRESIRSFLDANPIQSQSSSSARDRLRAFTVSWRNLLASAVTYPSSVRVWPDSDFELIVDLLDRADPRVVELERVRIRDSIPRFVQERSGLCDAIAECGKDVLNGRRGPISASEIDVGDEAIDTMVKLFCRLRNKYAHQLKKCTELDPNIVTQAIQESYGRNVLHRVVNLLESD